MNLNAKDDGQRLLARKGEAVPSEAMRPKPVAVALTDASGFVLSRDSSSGKTNSEPARKSEDRIAAATSSPPSSLLDYRLVRVSLRPDSGPPDGGRADGGRPDDGRAKGKDSAVPAMGRLTPTAAASVLPRDFGHREALTSRRLVKYAVLAVVVLLAFAFLIGAVSA
jgi:hypothetical protein